MSREYCVVLGDVIDSQRIKDREEFRRQLQSTLSAVNEQHDETIHAPFTYLKGIDEIGSVLKSVSPVANVQRQIARAVHPSQIRLAVTVGEIDVNADSQQVSQMDGPVFARADTVLSDIEHEGLTFRLSGKDSVRDVFISDEINLLDMIRNTWSERKMEIITLRERHETQKEVADSLGITTQAVSKHLRESNWEQVRGIKTRLNRNLKSYPELSHKQHAE